MNNIHLSEEAQNDLVEIKAYIEEESAEPFRRLGNRKHDYQKSPYFTHLCPGGRTLSSVTDIESDYRFIVSGNYISFYRAYGKEVYVDRILYARRDYMRILFGDHSAEETDE